MGKSSENMGNAINRGLELGKIIQQKNGESAGGIANFTQMLRKIHHRTW